MLSPFFDFNDKIRMMDRLFSQPAREESTSAWMSLRDAGDKLVLLADLPGVSSEDLEITIENDVLTLKAESKANIPEGYKLVRSERAKVRFVKHIELPVRVDTAAVAATLKDGVLELELPKALEARPRKIPVVGATPKAQA